MSSRRNNTNTKTVVPKTAEEIASIAAVARSRAYDLDAFQVFRSVGSPIVGLLIPKKQVPFTKLPGLEPQPPNLRDLYEDSIAEPPPNPDKWILVDNHKRRRQRQQRRRDDFPVVY